MDGTNARGRGAGYAILKQGWGGESIPEGKGPGKKAKQYLLWTRTTSTGKDF